MKKQIINIAKVAIALMIVQSIFMAFWALTLAVYAPSLIKDAPLAAFFSSAIVTTIIYIHNMRLDSHKEIQHGKEI